MRPTATGFPHSFHTVAHRPGSSDTVSAILITEPDRVAAIDQGVLDRHCSPPVGSDPTVVGGFVDVYPPVCSEAAVAELLSISSRVAVIAEAFRAHSPSSPAGVL